MTDIYYTGSVKCRDKILTFGKETVCMGILNVTPDSFSDGGRNYKFTDAMMNVKSMIEDGAKVIDVGGESTRPGYTEISVDEELSRIVPVVKAIRDNFDVIISIDTYKSKVAEGALEAGCHIINDIYGFMYDPNMASVVKKYDAAAILMFNCRRNGECAYRASPRFVLQYSHHSGFVIVILTYDKIHNQKCYDESDKNKYDCL